MAIVPRIETATSATTGAATFATFAAVVVSTSASFASSTASAPTSATAFAVVWLLLLLSLDSSNISIKPTIIPAYRCCHSYSFHD